MSKKRRQGPDLPESLYATQSLSREGLHGPYTKGLGTNATPLFLINLAFVFQAS